MENKKTYKQLKHERDILLAVVRECYADHGYAYMERILKECGEESRWGIVAGKTTPEEYDEWKRSYELA